MRRKSIVDLALAFTMASSMSMTAFAGSWEQDTLGWWYLEDDGSIAIGWKEIDGKQYYFDGRGHMLQDTITPDGYRVGSDGAWINEITNSSVPKMKGGKYKDCLLYTSEHHHIQFLTMKDIHYTFIGGVKKDEIPFHYPLVLDRRFHTSEFISDNYTPEWSRSTFIDIRNVSGLILEGIVLETIYPDEREAVCLDGCSILKKDIVVVNS